MSEITNKEILLRLMDDSKNIRDTQATHSAELRSIKQHTKDTNGQVARNLKEIRRLEVEMGEADHRTFRRLIKIGGSALILGAFVFVKESRDVIIAVLTKLFL